MELVNFLWMTEYEMVSKVIIFYFITFIEVTLVNKVT